jgi:imidazolonepropionase-like amidohydrolase
MAVLALVAAALAGCSGDDRDDGSRDVGSVRGDVIVTADRVFDGRNVIGHGVVVLRGNRVVAVGRQSDISATAPKWIALGNATVLPGFVDLHVHLLGEGQRLSPVTTVRDVGAQEEGLSLVRNRRGEPRVFYAGPLLTVPGGYPTQFFGGRIAGVVHNVAEARAAVRRLAREGATVIKVAVEWGPGGDWPVLSPTQLAAIVDQAHALGLPVTAHTSSMAAARRAFEAGVDELAHMPCRGEDPTLMRDLVANGIEIVGTLDVRQGRCPVVAYARAFVRAGGTLLYGSDYGNPGISTGLDVNELRLMVRAGLSTTEALTNATARAGEQLGVEKLGTLTVGAPADVVGVDGNPFVDLGQLRIPSLLVVRGVLVVEGGRIVLG